MNDVAIKVPLAEHFHSLQGEGRWTGLPMHFLRLPGCTVGKPAHSIFLAESQIPILPTGARAKACAAFDGKSFFCDTDYAKHEEATIAELMSETWEYDVCFTGGEPLMHEKQLWYKQLYNAFRSQARIHIETSGTIEPQLDYDWITVSPKKGWLPEVIGMANQVKFLIDKDTDFGQITRVLRYTRQPHCLIFFSPIFDPNEFVKENFDHCMTILREFKSFRPQVTVQMHKFLGLR